MNIQANIRLWINPVSTIREFVISLTPYPVTWTGNILFQAGNSSVQELGMYNNCPKIFARKKHSPKLPLIRRLPTRS